ncbi:MAG: xylulokinase [Fusobacteriaceae bacterium]
MYVGIDLGTSAVKLLLMDSSGNVIKTISKEYPLIFPKENWIEQDPDQWIEKTFAGIKEFSKEERLGIKAISFSGQMHGSVFLNWEDKIIRPALLWCDQRTTEECKHLNEKFGKKIIELTGNIALTGFTAPKILWLKNNEPKNFEKIQKIMLPKDYLAYRLSGVFSMDMSDASGTLLLDVKNRKWSSEMVEAVGITIDKLPKLFESYEVVGKILPNIAEELGLNSDVKIVAGGGDQAVGAVGVGVVKDGILSVALGTSGVVFANSSNYSADKEARLHSFCHGNGGYHQMGVMLSAAGALKWWVEGINKSKDYTQFVEKEAQNSKFDKNIFFLPYLTGERTPHNDPDARGSFIGLNVQHERGDMTRAVIEGINFGLRDSLELIRGMKISTDVVRVSGGGAKSEFWKQMIADIFNSRVETVNSTEGPAFGAAILAAVGDGVFPSVDQACEKLIKVLDFKMPNSDSVKIYEEKYIKFRKLYPLLSKVNQL